MLSDLMTVETCACRHTSHSSWCTSSLSKDMQWWTYFHCGQCLFFSTFFFDKLFREWHPSTCTLNLQSLPLGILLPWPYAEYKYIAISLLINSATNISISHIKCPFCITTSLHTLAGTITATSSGHHQWLPCTSLLKASDAYDHLASLCPAWYHGKFLCLLID